MKKVLSFFMVILLMLSFLYPVYAENEEQNPEIETPVAVTSVTLNHSTLTLEVGGTATLTATVLPENAADKTVTWTTSSASVATVSTDGVVTAAAAGEATITAKAGEKTATCTVTVSEPTVAVTSVTLNHSTLTLEVGSTATLTATVLPANATDKTVTWTTSSASVATVTTDGTVTAAAPGEATITARTTDGGYTATCTVTVKKIDVSSVKLSSSSLKLKVGDEGSLTATVSPKNATNPSVTWKSSNESVVTVSTGGAYKATGSGEATITAAADGKEASCTVTVKPHVESITLNKTTLSLYTGDSATLTATLSPADATGDSIKWSSSNTSLATVSDDGVVNAIAAGDVTITAECDKKTATCALTIIPYIKVSTVTLDYTSMSLDVNATATLTATVSPSDATNGNVTWSSSDPTIATVTDGVLTAVSGGTATITAAADGKSASCTVTVKVPVTKLTIKSSTTIGIGRTEKLTPEILPSNATYQGITWSSSKPEIATVDNGLIKGITGGMTIITAKTLDGSNLSATCIVTVTDKEVAVSGVSVTPGSLTLTEGETGTLTATVTPSAATNQNVVWTSSDTSVVTVTGGKLTAVKKGTATITATTDDGGFAATCTVTVNEVDRSVKGVSLNKTSTSMKIGGTETLTATVEPTNAANKNVTWSSSDASIVKVSGGYLTAVNIGTATITVKTEDGGKTATCKVTVTDKDIEVTAIAVDKTEAEVNVGSVVTIIAMIAPYNATNQNIRWSSSDEKIATVSGGVVTGVSVGEVTITATSVSSDLTAACKLTVKPVVYKMTEGANGSWEKGGGEGLSFRSEADPNEFKSIQVDGAELTESSYTVKEGLVTLDPVFLENLAIGLHTIEIVSENGVASAPFTIVDGEKAPECLHENTRIDGFVEATCTQKGYTGNVCCEDCGKTISQGEEIDYLDHEFVNGVCAKCGADDPNFVPSVTESVPKWLAPVGIAVVAAALVAIALIILEKRQKLNKN